jgi:ParB-like chromosome segregation protein Spo0J
VARQKFDGERQTDKTKRIEIGSLWFGPNARQHIARAALDSLKGQVRQDGVLEQILVRRTVNPDNPEQRHQIWDGQRRLLAVHELIAEGAPIQSVPARVEPASTTDAEMMILAAITTSGIGKEPLTPVDEMRLVTMLRGYDLSPADIARRLGKSVSWVSKRAKLKTTTPAVQREVSEGRMTTTKAQQLAGQPQEQQDQAAADSKAGKKGARKAAPARPGKKAIMAMLADALTAERTGAAMALRYAAGEMTAEQLRDALRLDAPKPSNNNPQPPARPAVP